MQKIDFVIPWVNGGDPEWIEKKNGILKKENENIDHGENRYRDWGNLKYWFRGVEKYAPWVHKVYFISDNQKPDWLNTDCSKLEWITHEQYIPSQFLPTFSANPIELNLHRIKGLSEKIVYFNDDTFLLKPIKPSIFFKRNTPVHPASIHAIVPLPTHSDEIMSHIYVNDVSLINRHFDSKETIRKNWKKWLCPWNVGLKNSIMTLFNMQHSNFIGFGNEHLPVPILKSVMEELWEQEEAVLTRTSKHHFRNAEDVNQYIFRYWNLASGNFYATPVGKIGKYYMADFDTSKICDTILKQSANMICINDMSKECTYDEFVQIRNEINAAFDRILPNKSMFER